MQDIHLQSAWTAFCESSSLNKSEKGEYLNKFLCLLFETTPIHEPIIGRLGLRKHQVISSYIGSHFLLELENLCRDTALLERVKKSSENEPFAASVLTSEESSAHPGAVGAKTDHQRVFPVLTVTKPSEGDDEKGIDRVTEGRNDRGTCKELGGTECSVEKCIETGIGVTDRGVEEKSSETSLCVHFSEESLSSAVTHESASSAKVNRRRPIRSRDAVRLRMQRDGCSFLQEPRVTAGSSDHVGDSERGGAGRPSQHFNERVTKPDADQISGDQFSCPEDDIIDSEVTTHPSIPSSRRYEKECSDVEGDECSPTPSASGPPREEELMKAIREFLTVGRGAKMLMVLDQIGAVSTTIGYEIIKFLDYIFEYFLDELIHGEQNEHEENLGGGCRSPACKTRYDCMISDIKLSDVFKPILNPKTPFSSHPTPRIQAFLANDLMSYSKSRATSNFPSSKKCVKQVKMRRSSSTVEKDPDSEENGERIRRQYFEYKKTLQTCECFHPESLLKRRLETEGNSNHDQRRPMTLSLDELLGVILSVMTQVGLYDPFSSSIDNHSSKCAQHILDFSCRILSKLSSDVETLKAFPAKQFLLKRLSIPLIKMAFSGSRKFLKDSSQYTFLSKLNIAKQLFEFADILLMLSKEVSVISEDVKITENYVLAKNARINFTSSECVSNENKVPRNRTKASDATLEQSQFWMADILADIALGVILILTSVSCEKGRTAFSPEGLLHIEEFLLPEYLVTFTEIFILTIELNLEQKITLFQSLTHLILYLKIWKEDFLHSFKCDKSTHKSCEYPTIVSHHFFDCSDFECSHLSKKDQSVCVIWVLVKLLLDCFKHFQDNDICFTILQLLSKSGLCCCCPLSSLLAPLMDGIELRSEKLQIAVVAFIESTVWFELRGLDTEDKNNECHVCQFNDYKDPVYGGSVLDSVIPIGIGETWPLIASQKDIDTKDSSRWSGLDLYSAYIFSPTVGPLITKHLAILLRASKWSVVKEIIHRLLLPASKTLFICEFQPLHDIISGNKITNNLLKCLRFSYCIVTDVTLIRLMQEKGVDIIKYCKKNSETRYEALNLLCAVVDKEQKYIQRNIPNDSLIRELVQPLGNIFSQFFLAEIRNFESFWMNYFEQSSLQVRTKAKIQSLPAFHSLQCRENCTKDSSNFEKKEYISTDCSQGLDWEEEQGSIEATYHRMSEGSEDNFKCLDYQTLLENYASFADFWQLTSEMMSESEEFLCFLAKAQTFEMVAQFLLSVVRDYARASNNLLDEPSVVYKNLVITLSLCRSLLTSMILCFPTSELQRSLEEVRHHILRISSCNCSDIRAFISMLLQCAFVPNNKKCHCDPTHSRLLVFGFEKHLGIESEASSAVDTDGYDADTEINQPNRIDSSTSYDSDLASVDVELNCPELIIVALDLVINHHEKYLEAKQLSITVSSGGSTELPKQAALSSTEKEFSSKERIINLGKGLNKVSRINEKDEDERRISRPAEQLGINGTGMRRNSEVIENNAVFNRSNGEGAYGYTPVTLQLKEESLLNDNKSELNGEEKSLKFCSASEVYPDGGLSIGGKSRKDVTATDIKNSSTGEANAAAHGTKPSSKKKRKGKRKRGRRHCNRELNFFSSETHEKSFDKDIVLSIAESSPSATDTHQTYSTDASASNTCSNTLQVATSSSSRITESSTNTTPVPSSFDDTVSVLDRCDTTVPAGSTSGTVSPLCACSNTCLASSNSNVSKDTSSLCKESDELHVDPVDCSPGLQPSTKDQPERDDESNAVTETPSSLSSFLKPPLCTRIEETHLKVLNQTLHDILLICKRSASVCLQLQNLSFLQKLIDGFNKIINEKDSTYEEVASTVMSIWCEVAQHGLETLELAQYFGLFKTERPPVNTLLRSLSRVFGKGNRTPHFTLTFPYYLPDNHIQEASLEDSFSRSFMSSLMSLTSFVEVRVPVSPLVEVITSLRNEQIRNQVTSCVSTSCLICPICRSLDWSPYHDGASIATWISLQRRYSQKPSLHFLQRHTRTELKAAPFKGNRTRIHVLSIGTQHLMFSVWLEGHSGKIYVSASIETTAESKTVDEFCLEKVGLKSGDWHHLALVLPKVNVKRGGVASLTLLLDGLRSFSIPLNIPPIGSIKKSTPSYLLIGHIGSFDQNQSANCCEHSPSSTRHFPDVPPDEFSPAKPPHLVSMGIVFVFREPVLTNQTCLGLLALGKNASSLVVAAPNPHKTVFVNLINRKLLCSKIDRSFLFKDLRSLLAPLQENLLLQFSPHDPAECTYYKKATPAQPDRSGSLYPLCASQKTIAFMPVDQVERKTPELALLKLGGASHLVFLVARIAELGKNAKSFADALSLLFRLCRQEPTIGLQLSVFGGANLICRLIKAPEAPSGVLVLKALIEACIEPTVIQFEACRNLFCVAAHIPAFVVDRGLLETILINWRCFLKETHSGRGLDEYACLDPLGNELNCIGIILSVINVLLLDSCPYREFNFIQLKDIRALSRIIEIFEELKAENVPLENVCSPELIVTVVALLLGGKCRSKLCPRMGSRPQPLLHDSGSSSDFSESVRLTDSPSLLGMIIPTLNGAELAEVGNFLLYLHPDELTYVSTDAKDAYYLQHRPVYTARTTGAGADVKNCSFTNGSEALNSKFSQFSLRGDITSSPYDSSPDPSFECVPIEEGEDPLSTSATSIAASISPITLPLEDHQPNDSVSDGTHEGVCASLSVRCSSPNNGGNCRLRLNREIESSMPDKMCKTSSKIIRRTKCRSLSVHRLDSMSKVDEGCLRVFRRSSSENFLTEKKKVPFFVRGSNVQPKYLEKGLPSDDNTVLKSISDSPNKFLRFPKDEGPETKSKKQLPKTKTCNKISKPPELSENEPRNSEKSASTEIQKDSRSNASCVDAGTSATTLSLMMVGILNVIEEALRNLTETQAVIVISEMFSIDLVILLANNPVSAVRSAALGLFRTMLLRGGNEYLSFHSKRLVLELMSLQLHKHSPSSEALVAEAFALALKVDLKLDDDTIDDVVLSPNHKLNLFVPLFAILPSCSADVALCHNTLSTFLHILKMNEDLLVKIYLKTRFVNSILLTMRNVLHEDPKESEACLPSVVVNDVFLILSYLVSQLVALDGNAPFATCREVLCTLNIFYRREMSTCSPESECCKGFEKIEMNLFDFALRQLRIASNSVGQRHSQFIMFPQDSTSSTNSEQDDLKAYTRTKSLKGFRKFTNFFQRSSLSNKETANQNSEEASFGKRSPSRFESGASPVEVSPCIQRLSLSNIAESYRVMLQLCINSVILIAQSQRDLRGAQVQFAFMVLSEMRSCLEVSVQFEESDKKSQAQGEEYLALSCTNIVENFLVLLTQLVSSKMGLTSRLRILTFIDSEPQMKRILRYCARVYMPLLYRFGIFLHDLRHKHSDLSQSLLAKIDGILEYLRECGVAVLPPLEAKATEWSVVAEERRKWAEDMVRMAGLIRQQNAVQETKLLLKPKLNLMHDQICAEGTRVSWQLLETQNERLKSALKRIKDFQCKSIKYTYCWRDIVDLVTNEKAPWFLPEAFPSGWKLDGTEGPLRIRKRLTRCRLNVDSKFFLPYCAHRHNKRGPALQHLLVEPEIESALSHIVESISEDEKLLHTCHASFIAPTVEQQGEFLISHRHLYFIGEETLPKDALQQKDMPAVISKMWPADVVREVHLRRYRLKDCAVELFSTNGQSALLAFSSEKERNEVMSLLSTLQFPNLKRETSLGEYMSLWREGVITNFEYLTQLNKLAGRSFNDLMQYPVFPFVLNDYTTKCVNLEDPSLYRNLKKPVPIQKEEKDQHFKDNYETSKQMSEDGPYHYGSHYSNSGIVLYYLIRLPPFTQLFLDFQDGNFDVPDRSFHSLEITWRLASSDSTTAIRELIPEFFFFPEIFSNTQGFRFGVRQNGEMVNHVQLPPWCHGDPRKFVLVHRAMLESGHVTQQLQHWIDLVFGSKQTGKAAVEAINVFHPATYFGFDVEIDSDELTVEARRTMIRTYGQTPRQLLTHPHPSPSLSTFPHIKPTSGSGKNDAPPVLSEVSGIPWGIYAGSPADPKPYVQLVQSLQTNIRSLVSISPNEVMLLTPDTVIHTVKTRKGDVLSLHRYVISWKHNDGIVRCRRHPSSLVFPLISLPLYNKVTRCALSQNQLWLGTESGQVLVYLVSALPGKGELIANAPNHPLLAHTAPISCLIISHDFKVCFSGGEDGAVVLWDINRLAYIRSVTVSEDRMSLLGVSETLGDWVSVTHSPQSERSVIRYYTINAEFIDSVSIEALVTCVAFSGCPEGRAVNVIAVGATDRYIRLFSTWDLALVRVLHHDRIKETPISLLYTENNYHLCVITESQSLVVWETSQAKCKLPKFITVGVTG